jgi:hypothetical protein
VRDAVADGLVGVARLRTGQVADVLVADPEHILGPDIVATPSGSGYWITGEGGDGYWLIGADGAVYPFGDAAPLTAQP